MTRSVLLCLALGVTTTACIGTSAGRNALLDDGRTGLGWKTVARKVEPVYVVAIDQTSCTVSAERFRQIQEGQRLLCDWKGGAVFVDRGGAHGGARLPANATGSTTARGAVIGPGADQPAAPRPAKPLPRPDIGPAAGFRF